VVLDAFSRRAVGWALGRSLQTSLPLATLESAIHSRQPRPGLVHHSDRGSPVCQQGVCGAAGEHQRRAEHESCWAAVGERAMRDFLKTLKQEEIDACPYHTLEELEQHIAEFIEQIYNRVRLHSALGYKSPAEFESRLAQAATVPAWMPAGLSLHRHEEVPVLGQPPEGQP